MERKKQERKEGNMRKKMLMIEQLYIYLKTKGHSSIPYIKEGNQQPAKDKTFFQSINKKNSQIVQH